MSGTFAISPARRSCRCCAAFLAVRREGLAFPSPLSMSWRIASDSVLIRRRNRKSSIVRNISFGIETSLRVMRSGLTGIRVI